MENKIEKGDKVKVIKYKCKELVGREGIVKQVAKTGKYRVTIDKWNYWLTTDEIEKIDELKCEGIEMSALNVMRIPKYKIGQELKIIKDNIIVSACNILIEYDGYNRIKNIYYKLCIDDKILMVTEEELTDEISNWDKYIKKPIEVYAYQTHFRKLLNTHNGDVWAEVEDYIIRDIEGKEYPCKKEIFLKTYDKVENIEGGFIEMKNSSEVVMGLDVANDKSESKSEEIVYKVDKDITFAGMSVVEKSDEDGAGVINVKEDKKEMYNYAFKVGEYIVRIDTPYETEGKIVSRKCWNGRLQYEVLIDNKVILIDEYKLKIKGTKDVDFIYKVGDKVVYGKRDSRSRVWEIIDKKYHVMPDGRRINQYHIKEDIFDRRLWINENEIVSYDIPNSKFNIGDKVLYDGGEGDELCEILDRKYHKTPSGGFTQYEIWTDRWCGKRSSIWVDENQINPVGNKDDISDIALKS